jgi:hypothetical protein
MSYSDYLRTKQINTPRIIDSRQRLGDASAHTWRTKLGATHIFRPTDHVLTNNSDPFIQAPSTKKQPLSITGTGFGGRVQDASTFTLYRGAKSIRNDTFPRNIIIDRGCNAATPAASIVVNINGNFDGQTIGLNQGYQSSCCNEPLTKTCFVERLPQLKRIGTAPRTASNPFTQNPLDSGCDSVYTKGNWEAKDVKSPLHSPRPIKTDFRTSISGPQVSPDGSSGRAPKVGALIARSKYIEKHHGSSNNAQIVYPKPFNPDTKYIPKRLA